jgi:hypothetical protein
MVVGMGGVRIFAGVEHGRGHFQGSSTESEGNILMYRFQGWEGFKVESLGKEVHCATLIWDIQVIEECVNL